MRSLLLVLPALLALTAFTPSQSHADPYPWCALYGGDEAGATNCGFLTWNQCMATVSGIGGYCEPNQFYTGPEPRVRKQRARVRHY